MSESSNRRILLVDNGSLNPEATLNLRRVAGALSKRLRKTVYPVSIAHSDRVEASDLDGQPALLLETCLRDGLSKNITDFEVIPFIFAERGGIAALMRRKLEALRAETPSVSFCIAPFLFDERLPENLGVARILEQRVREVICAQSLKQPAVVMVDHGSPHVQAAYVRNIICGQLSAFLGEGLVKAVGAASMERRLDEHYAFNEPLLENRLRTAPFNNGDVVLAQLFLSPGKHAGADGDIAQICEEAQKVSENLKVHRCELVGTHSDIIEILVNRYQNLSGKKV